MTLADDIQKARAQGYSDSEIQEYLSSNNAQVKSALAEGHSIGDIWKFITETSLPRVKGQYTDLYEKAAKENNLDPLLLQRIAQVESNEQPSAVSGKGARGMMQLMPATASALGVADPHDPEQAIPAAAKLMRQNLDASKGDLRNALMMYHGGTNQANWGPLTQAYPDKVLADYTPSSESPTSTVLPPEATASGDKPLPSLQPDVWGPLSSTINGLLASAGVPIEAAGTATKELVSAIQRGVPIRDALSMWMEHYRQSRDIIGGQREQYGRENPFTAGATELAGNLPLAIAGGELAGLPLAGVQQGVRNLGLGLRTALGSVRGAMEGMGATIPGLALSDESVQKQIGLGALFGGSAGAAKPLASKVGEAVLPTIDKAKAELAQWAIDNGIPIFRHQLDPNSFRSTTARVSGGMPFSGKVASDTAQLEAFTRRLIGTMGEDADRLSPEVMDRAATRIGREMDAIAARSGVVRDTGLDTELQRIRNDLSLRAMGEGEKKGLERQLDNIESHLAKGYLTGEEYQTLTRYGNPLMSAARSSHPDVRYLARDIRRQLDEGLSRTTAAMGNPDDAQRLAKLRGQYKNMLTIEDLAERVGTEGLLQPKDMSKLLTQVIKKNPDFAYVGAGDIGKLAQIGNEFIKQDLAPEALKDTRKMARLVAGGELLAPAAIAGGHAFGASPAMSLAALLGISGAAGIGAGAYRTLARPGATSAILNRTLGRTSDELPRLLLPLAVEGRRGLER